MNDVQVYNAEEIEEFKQILKDSYGFENDAQILDAAQSRVHRHDGVGIALLLRALNDETLKKGAALLNADSKEREFRKAIQRAAVQWQA